MRCSWPPRRRVRLRSMRPVPSSSGLLNMCGQTSVPAVPRPPQMNCRTWRRRRACPTPSRRTSRAAGPRSTPKPWTMRTSSFSTRSTTQQWAHRRCTTSPRARSLTSTTTTGSTSSFNPELLQWFGRYPPFGQRHPEQRSTGDQPAHHRDRTCRDDRQRRVTVLHANQIRVVLVVLDVDPHTGVELGGVQHPEFGAVRDAVGSEELERRGAGACAQRIRVCHAHMALDLPVVSPCPEHEQRRLQGHQTRGDDDADADPAEDQLRPGLVRIPRQARNQTAPQRNQSRHRAALIDACSARSDDRSAFTSRTRIPSNGSPSAPASWSASICRLSTWYARHSAPTSTSCGVPKIRDDTSENLGSPCSSSSKMPPPLSLDTTMVRLRGDGSVGPMSRPELSCTNVRSPINAIVRAGPMSPAERLRSCASAAPIAVDTVPSMPATPRFDRTLMPCAFSPTSAASRTGFDAPSTS